MRRFNYILILSFLFLGLGFVVDRAYADEDASMQDIIESIVDLHESGLTADEILDEIKEEYDAKIVVGEDDEDSDEDEEKKRKLRERRINFGQFKKTLRNGSAGDDVLELQESLNSFASDLGLDFPVLTEDGRYGPMTARAVRLFQLHNRLSVDGVVGSRTIERLRDFFEDKMKDDDDEDEDDDDEDEDDDDEDEDDDDEDEDDDDEDEDDDDEE